MVRYSGFVAEDAESNAIGYWFSPAGLPIETAPILRFDVNGNFCILRGNGIVEALLVLASHASDKTFSDLRNYFNKHGFNIAIRRIHDVQQPECALHPQSVYQQLIHAYSEDLLTTSPP